MRVTKADRMAIEAELTATVYDACRRAHRQLDGELPVPVTSTRALGLLRRAKAKARLDDGPDDWPMSGLTTGVVLHTVRPDADAS